MAWKLFWDLLCVAIDGCLLLKKDGFCRFQSSCGAVAFSSPNWMFWWVLCNVNTCVVLWPLVSEPDDSLNCVMDMYELLCLKKWSVGTDIAQPREGLWTSSIVQYLMAACCSQRIGSVGWLLFLTSTPPLSHLVARWHLVVWTLNLMFLSIVYIWIYLYELLGLNKGTGCHLVWISCSQCKVRVFGLAQHMICLENLLSGRCKNWFLHLWEIFHSCQMCWKFMFSLCWLHLSGLAGTSYMCWFLLWV